MLSVISDKVPIMDAEIAKYQGRVGTWSYFTEEESSGAGEAAQPCYKETKIVTPQEHYLIMHTYITLC